MPLKDDDPQKWIYAAHTKVKHEILDKYLRTWINILGNSPKVCYFDCFAGRGRYINGDEGSPIIALKAAADLKKNREHIREIKCVFIEKDKNNYDNLVEVVNEEIEQYPKKYNGINVGPLINDEFSNVVAEIGKNNNCGPSFYFIDPFGFGGIPLKIIKELLAVPKTEVFINFMIRDVNRFLTSPNHKNSLNELFGVDDIEVALGTHFFDLSPKAKESTLLKVYRNQLHEVADVNFTFPFKVNEDEKLQTTYYLIHATNHLKGCELMKAIMYSTGTKTRFGYLGPAEGQMAINSFNLDELKDYLLNTFLEQELTYEEVRKKTVNDIFFIERDYRNALRELEVEANILIEGKGPQGRIKDKSVIHFNPDLAKKVADSKPEPVTGEQKKQRSLFDF